MSLLLRICILVLLVSAMLLVTNCSAQTSCSIRGAWILSKGLVFFNYGSASPYTSNRLVFHQDSVELASGFFYSLEGIYDDHIPGRYPFVYYGNLEKYEIVGDSLKVFNTPYKSWSSYGIVCRDSEHVLLVGRRDTLVLNRPVQKKARQGKAKKIQYVKAHIDDGNTIVSLYKLNYKVTYTDDDSLVYEEWDEKAGIFQLKKYKLKEGTFERICAGFEYVDMETIQDVYVNLWSDFIFQHVEIGFNDGSVIKTTIQGSVGPDELRIALVPVFYGHQKILYGDLPPKSWDEF